MNLYNECYINREWQCKWIIPAMQCSLFHELRMERAGVFQHVSQQAACTRSHWGIAVCQHRLQQLIIFYKFTKKQHTVNKSHTVYTGRQKKRNPFSFIHNFLNTQYNLTKFGFIIHKRIVINAIWLIFELYTNLHISPHKKFDVNITSLITVYKTAILCKETVNLLSNETSEFIPPPWTPKLQEIFHACYPRPWHGPRLTITEYVMHFQFRGWRHVCT